MLAQIRIGNTASKNKYRDAYEKLAGFNEKTCLLKEDDFLYALASFRYHSTFESTIYSNIDQIRNLRWMTMNSNDAIYEDVYRKFLNDVPEFMVNMEIEYWRERDSSSLCTSAKMRSQCTEEIIDAVGRYRHRLPAKYDLPENLLEFDSACDAVVYSGDSYMKIDICGRGD
ncbi:hypothetical protein HPQ64_18125 [Rhizobiales bacterium]|uniref:hypothetical protein n=1 Tax=Hongsoonwoonella zoysiae TaxID=2821844 RepID=UPI00155F7686|nr:hypothetical protein [Hongsoonwoonella zoysiae]NRG19612.1 hypothetical protein [Hongsoonwoonella zoysiae]